MRITSGRDCSYYGEGHWDGFDTMALDGVVLHWIYTYTYEISRVSVRMQ